MVSARIRHRANSCATLLRGVFSLHVQLCGQGCDNGVWSGVPEPSPPIQDCRGWLPYDIWSDCAHRGVRAGCLLPTPVS